MIRRHESSLRFALMALDSALTLVVLATVFAARFGPDWIRVVDEALPQPGLFVAAYVLVWIGLLNANGLYRVRARWSIRSEAKGVAEAAAILAFATLAVVFFLDLENVSRLSLVLIFPLQAGASILARVAVRRALRNARAEGDNLRSVLVVGTGRAAMDFQHKLQERWDLGLRVEGFVGPDPSPVVLASPYLGPVEDLPTLLHERVIDEVAICLPLEERDRVQAVFQLCVEEGKTIRIPMELPGQALSESRVEDLDGTPVLSVMSGPYQVLPLAAKRALDIVGATLGLLVLSPVFAAAALAIVATDGRPVIFRQQRAGMHGRHFSIVKFRTMTRQADALRAGLRELNEVSGNASFKLRNDPRVTRVGRILRKTSIDELPQLWNVLRGQMSLVGPRPHPFDDVAGYDGWHRRRLSMKPGITGLWQVAGRLEPNFDRWVELDLQYIDQWSLWLDLRLILKTIPAMLRAEGR
jgi:exopolysaccharide biosynthesis polyprenyl glycosylphosphotransferase